MHDASSSFHEILDNSVFQTSHEQKKEGSVFPVMTKAKEKLVVILLQLLLMMMTMMQMQHVFFGLD